MWVLNLLQCVLSREKQMPQINHCIEILPFVSESTTCGKATTSYVEDEILKSHCFSFKKQMPQINHCIENLPSVSERGKYNLRQSHALLFIKPRYSWSDLWVQFSQIK